MAHPKFDLQVYYEGQLANFTAVKVKDSFLIYKDGKALTALHKQDNQWEQLLLEPVSDDLLNRIVAELDKSVSNQ